jgi:hypothetical protein
MGISGDPENGRHAHFDVCVCGKNNALAFAALFFARIFAAPCGSR